MRQVSPTLRPARPVLEEGVVYARFLNELAPGFRYTLGRQAVDALAEAYVKPGHDLSYEYATFAEDNGKIIGVVAGYMTEQHRRSVEGGAEEAIGRRGLFGMRTHALTKWLRYFGPEEEGEFYVWLLSVSEERRGHGIGTMMMDHAEERARAAGATMFSLDMEFKNDGARRFYERRGMTQTRTWPKVPLMPPQVSRMSKTL